MSKQASYARSQMLQTGLQNAKNIALREFFWQHEPNRSNHLCWNWPKYCSRQGYGYIVVNGYKFSVHRMSFEHYKGLIPKGMVVMHECDNPSCFNPRHLFLGTYSENTQDMLRKGRRPRRKKLTIEDLVWDLAKKKSMEGQRRRSDGLAWENWSPAGFKGQVRGEKQ